MKPYLTILFITVLGNPLWAQNETHTLGKRKKPTAGPATTVQTANKTSNVSTLIKSEGPIKMRLKLPGNKLEKDYMVTKVDHLYILNGDIIVGSDLPKTMSIARNDADYRWPDATIPIVIDPTVFDAKMEDIVFKAVREFNDKTKLCVVQRTNEQDFVRITVSPLSDGAGGSSKVGRQGGEQSVFITSGMPAPVLIHELMHAAGFFHEQGKSNRDDFINIDYSNVIEAKKNNFQVEEEGVPIGNEYDYRSIMHYPSVSFAIDESKPTITCKNSTLPDCNNVIGNAQGLTNLDIQGIDLFYSNVSRFPCNTPFPGVVVSTVRFPNITISESDKAMQSFRHRAEYASKNGFAAGFPNFHEARQGINIVGGTILIKHGMTVWRDVPLLWLNNPSLSDFAARMRATQDYAVKRGFIGGFPNYFNADYGSGMVCGTFLLTNAAAEWRDVPISELGNPPLNDIGARMRSANDYAFRNGFLGGFPTFYHADYGKGIVCGIILIKKEAGEWRDVVIAAGPR